MPKVVKVGNYGGNFLVFLSHPIEIGPTDLHMTPNAFGAIKFLMATYTEQDIQKN